MLTYPSQCSRSTYNIKHMFSCKNSPINRLARLNLTIQAQLYQLIETYSRVQSRSVHQSSMLRSMGPSSMQALITFLLLAPLLISAVAPPSGYRFTLTHVDSKGGFTKAELMRRAAHRSRSHRAITRRRPSVYSTTSSSSDTRPTRLFSGQAEYLMELAIGTPPLPFVALVDTGSDLTWTQCQPCKLCFAQDTPIYDPAASSTFFPVTCASDACRPIWRTNCSAALHCRYRYVYGDGAYSAGVMGTEALTFGGDGGVSVAGIAFGCGVDNGGLSYNSTGTVGLGRGSLSLVAQLGVGKFSYCLTDFFNTSLGSPVLFGSLAELAGGGNGAIAAVQSTPLIQNLQNPLSHSWYFVSLEGISLGDTRLSIPNGTFDIRADGSGGMIVDSGTIFTILAEPGFRVVVDRVAGVLGQRSAVNASSLDSPCFPAPAGARWLPAMPDMVFHFAGGADMRLQRDNYMWFNEEDELFCLNIAGTKQTWTSVLGNFQQQNIQMLFDVTVGQLSFVTTDCSML